MNNIVDKRTLRLYLVIEKYKRNIIKNNKSKK